MSSFDCPVSCVVGLQGTIDHENPSATLLETSGSVCDGYIILLWWKMNMDVPCRTTNRQSGFRLQKRFFQNELYEHLSC